MKRFIAFVKKEFYHIFRDWRTLLILIGMPVAQVLLFGFAITNEIKNAPIAILDHSGDFQSKKLISKVIGSGYFIVERYLTADDQMENIFKEGKIKQILVVEPDFANRLEKEQQATIQVISDASDPNTAGILFNYTRAITGDFTRELNLPSEIPLQINIAQRMVYNAELRGVFLFVPGTIAIILMLISAMMTSISITKEKELGTMEILLATPMAPLQIIIAKVVPYLLLAFSNAIIVLLLGYFVFDVPIRGSLSLLLAETLLFVLTALALGILISSKTQSQQVALMVSLMMLMLPTILLSGFMFPVENMPMMLQVISNAVPARWFIIIIKSIMIKGLGFEAVWKETLIMMGFLLGFILLSIRSFKLRMG